MDFSNERYVKLYTRDTTNWRRLGWKGQAALVLLLRKVDRSGALELEGIEPWEAVSLATGLPEDVTREGVAKMLEQDTVRVVGDLLVFPKHIEAQEALKSDRLRQKESRERRAIGLPREGSRTVTAQPVESRGVTRRHASAERSVTPCDAPVTPRDQTSRAVTPQPERSRAVTGGHSVLSCAVQSSAVLGSDARTHGSRQAELESLVGRAFATRFEQAEHGLWTRRGDPAVGTLAAWLGSVPGDAAANLARLLDNFFADRWCHSQHFPIEHLAKRPQKYFEERSAPRPEAKVDTSERLAVLSSNLETLKGDLQNARNDADGGDESALEVVAELVDRMDEIRAEMRKLKGAA